MKIPITSLTGGAAYGSGTRYTSLAGQGTYVAGINTSRTPMSVGGVISNLYVKLTPALTTGSYVITLMVNGSATGLTCTVSAGASEASDTDPAHAVTVSATDLCEWRVVGSGADTLTQSAFTALFESGVARSAPLFAGHGTAAAAALFIPPGGMSLITTEGFGTGIMAVAGDISSMRVKLTTAPGGTATRVYTLRKNGSDTGLAVTLNPSDTDVSASYTVSFDAGDKVTIGLTIANAPASTHAGIALTWNPTVNGYFPMIGVGTSAFATTGTRYFSPMGTTPGNATAETGGTMIAPAEMTIDQLYAEISTAPTGATKSRTFTLRTSGADTALTTAITDTAIANSDLDVADAQTVSAGILVSLSQVTANTPTAIATYNRVGMRGFITPTDVTGRTGMLLLGAG